MKLNDPLDLVSVKLFGFGFSVSIDTYFGEPSEFLPNQAFLRIELSYLVGELRREWTLMRYE